MKLLFQIITGLLITVSVRNVSAQKYTVDANASTLKWTGHAQAGAYSPQGTLRIKSGSLTIANGKLIAGKVVVDMTTLHQDSSEMQEHLRNPDFFDVTKYPEAALVVKSVNGNSVNADLTIKGITKPIKFTVDLKTEQGKVIVQAELHIDRTQYGIKYNSTSYFQDLGSYAIKNDFELNVALVANN